MKTIENKIVKLRNELAEEIWWHGNSQTSFESGFINSLKELSEKIYDTTR